MWLEILPEVLGVQAEEVPVIPEMTAMVAQVLLVKGMQEEQVDGTLEHGMVEEVVALVLSV